MLAASSRLAAVSLRCTTAALHTSTACEADASLPTPIISSKGASFRKVICFVSILFTNETFAADVIV